jgi:hypothetical protein
MKKLKETNVSLDQLYNEEKQVRIKVEDSKHEYTLVMIGRDKEPDFMLSSWQGNIYCRTNFGINRKKYTSLNGVEKAAKNLVRKKLGYEGKITFTISEEINPF